MAVTVTTAGPPPFVEGQGVSEWIAWSGIASGFVGLLITSALPKRVVEGREKVDEVAEAAEVTETCRGGEGEHRRRRSPREVSRRAHTTGGDGPGDVTRIAVKESTAPLAGQMTRAFVLFQRSFLMADVTASFADWLKGAYTMSLYAEYGFTLEHISLFFILTFLSSVVFGTISGAVSDSFGRARSCRLYCFTYAASLLLTMWNDVYAIGLARVLGGLSTSLLMTSFESWVVAEHHARGFEAAWLQDTFAKSAVLGSASAVVAGFVAEAAVRALGNVGPFLVPLPFLFLTLVLMQNWTENYGDRSGTVWRTLANGWREIAHSRSVQLLLLCEALYEGSLGVWLVMWTPSLDSTNTQTPFGLVFAAYTLGMVSGGLLARVLALTPLLVLCHFLGFQSMLMAVVLYDNKTLVFASFMLFEASTGVYSAAHPTLRSSVMGDASRASVMNIFRVPMNMIVVGVLLFNPSPRTSLGILVALQAVSGVALWLLERTRR